MNHYSAIATDYMHSISMCMNANKAHHAKHNYANFLKAKRCAIGDLPLFLHDKILLYARKGEECNEREKKTNRPWSLKGFHWRDSFCNKGIYSCRSFLLKMCSSKKKKQLLPFIMKSSLIMPWTKIRRKIVFTVVFNHLLWCI